MKKSYIITIIALVLIGLISSVYNYMQIIKTDTVEAYDATKPANGHSWSEMQCTTDLCVTGGKVGIGTDAPSEKLDVNGVINVNSNKITNVALPVSSTDVATKAYVDASSGPSCPTNYANICSNGGGLFFTYSGKTMVIDAYPRASAWYTSGSPTGQALAWQMCGAIGARLPTLEEWQAACTALSGPNGNGTSTFGGGKSDRWEWTATPSSATWYNAVTAGGGTCTWTSADNVYADTDGTNDDWFRCVR